MTDLVIYEKKFEVQMSKWDSFELTERQMEFFDECYEERVMFKRSDWTRINPSFFVTAKPYDWIPWFSASEMKILAEKKKEFYLNTWRNPSKKEEAKIIEKIRLNLNK